jgi:hypothetical protein
VRFERARRLIFIDSKQAIDALNSNNIPKMEMVFKAGGIEKEAIFCVKSVEMLKVFLQYRRDMHKTDPRIIPRPYSLLFSCLAILSSCFRNLRTTRVCETDETD